MLTMSEVRKEWEVLLDKGSFLVVGQCLGLYKQESKDGARKNKLQVLIVGENGKQRIEDFECLDPELYKDYTGSRIVFPVFMGAFSGQDREVIKFGKTLKNVPPLLASQFFNFMLVKSNGKTENTRSRMEVKSEKAEEAIVQNDMEDSKEEQLLVQEEEKIEKKEKRSFSEILGR